MKLRIGILGTRGIPNHYGGFERFAEYLSAGLACKGYDVFVYNSHNHPYQAKIWNNVNIVHCNDPAHLGGSFSQFVYDLNCLRDAKKKNYDIILILGYTSSSVWRRFFPKKTTIIFNMDGLEWQRKKFKWYVRKFLRYAEKLAIKAGCHYVADSPVIQQYLQQKYKIHCEYIAYGAEILNNEDADLLLEYNISPHQYYLAIARMEPENNIEMILDAFHNTASDKKFIVTGNIDNRHGKYLVNKFKGDARIHFIGGIYDNSQKIHTLRKYCQLYFHGHSVGGTNPSLLEAMASKALIAAHDNLFNKAILGNNAYYFKNVDDLENILSTVKRKEKEKKMVEDNQNRIREEFSWHHIIDSYDTFIRQCHYKIKSQTDKYEATKSIQ